MTQAIQETPVEKQKQKKFKHNTKMLIVFSLLNLIITTTLMLFFSRMLIKNLGDEYNGLYRLIINIVAFLTIAESGIGAGIIQKSFQYYKNGELKKVNRLFSASRKLFVILGFVYIALFLAMAPVLAFILKSDNHFSYAKIVLVICILAAKLLPRYFYSGNKRLIFMTSGSGVWIKFAEMITAILFMIPMILYLEYGTANFQMFINILLIIVFSEIFSAILIYIMSLKVGKIGKLSWKIKIRDEIKFSELFFPTLIRIGGLILVNTDEIVLGGSSHYSSASRALLLISVYSSYLVFSNMINSVLNNIFGSMIFSIGANTGGDVKNISADNMKKAVLSTIIVTIGMFSLITLVSPYVVNFIFNTNNKPEYFSNYLALLFGGIALLTSIKILPTMIYKIQGVWKKYSLLVLVEVIINIILSLVLVKYMGIYGLLIATLVSQAITTPIYFMEYIKISKNIKTTKQLWQLMFLLFASVVIIIFVNIFIMPENNVFSILHMFIYIIASCLLIFSFLLFTLLYGIKILNIDFSSNKFVVLFKKIIKKVRR